MIDRKECLIYQRSPSYKFWMVLLQELNDYSTYSLKYTDYSSILSKDKILWMCANDKGSEINLDQANGWYGEMCIHIPIYMPFTVSLGTSGSGLGCGCSNMGPWGYPCCISKDSHLCCRFQYIWGFWATWSACVCNSRRTDSCGRGRTACSSWLREIRTHPT